MDLHRSPCCCVVLFAALLLLVAPAAATVTVSADSVAAGDQVAVEMSGISDGALLAIAIGVHAPPPVLARFQYQFTDFTVPFALTGGTWSASGNNVDYLEVRVLKNPNDLIYGFDEEGAGSVDVSGSQNVSAGSYRYVGLDADVNDTGAPVDLRFGLSGVKRGGRSDAASLLFRLPETASGSIEVSVDVDGENQLTKTIAVIPLDVTPPGLATTTGAAATPSSGPFVLAGAGALVSLALAAAAMVKKR